MGKTDLGIAKDKYYPDAYYLYEITGSGGGGGDDNKEYVDYDLGVYRGYVDPTYVYTLAGATAEDVGTWLDVTADAISAASSAFTAIPLADVQYDAFYIGAPFKFTGCSIDMGVAGVDAGTLVATWEYPNTISDVDLVTAWQDLNEEDNTATAAGKGLDAGTSTYTVEFEVPTDWVESLISLTDSVLNKPTSKMYWIKFMVGTAGYSTAPTIERIRLVRPLPATSLTILESLDDDCDLYLNTTNTAGTETEKTNIPMTLQLQSQADDFYTHNFTVKNLANTKIIKIWVEAHTGEWD
jgi:hypothetical protein